MSETVDTGFDDAIAGRVWKEPETPPQAVQITATVNQEPTSPEQPCETSSDVNAPSTTSASTILSAAGVQAAKSLVQLPDKSPSELARLARDFAMDIKERHVILQEHKLTETQYDFIVAHNEFYQAALHAACIEWHAPLSTPERIKVEAAAILEDSLIGLGARMQNKSEGLPGVIEAAKLFAKVAGVGERESGPGAPGERFTINIDLGGGKTITAQSSPAPEVATPSDQPSTPPAIGKAFGNAGGV